MGWAWGLGVLGVFRTCFLGGFLVAGGLNGLCLEVAEVPELEWTGLVTAGAGRGDDLGGEEAFFCSFFLVFFSSSFLGTSGSSR